jgi:hypothetical protein
MENPASGLHHKTIRVNFSEKIDVRDPFTMRKDSKHIKPFMVNNVVRMFERGQIVLNPDDREMTKQFQDYAVERWGVDGRPVYTSENEHIHDCVMLAIHGFVQKYSDMLKISTTAHIAQLKPMEYSFSPDVKNREIPDPNEQKQNPYIGLAAIGAPRAKRTSGRRSLGLPARKMF